MRLSAGLLPGRVNDRLISGGSDLRFWLAQPRCPDIRETPPRCFTAALWIAPCSCGCCSWNKLDWRSSVCSRLFQTVGCRQLFPPLWYVKLDGCILTSSLETMGQLGHINDSFQNSMFSKLNLETYGFRGVKHFQVLFAFSAQPAISAFISGRSSE